MEKAAYTFETIRIDLRNRLLTRDGQLIRLAPKTFDLLTALVENRGVVLSKEYLFERIWPGMPRDESTLTGNISLLRVSLGQRSEGREYIEGFPNGGYRFDADVREEPPIVDRSAVFTEQLQFVRALQSAGKGPVSRPEGPPARAGKRNLAIGVLAAILLIAVGFVLYR